MDTQQFISMLSKMPQAPQPVRRFQKGGKMMGPGNGVSDSIPAVIETPKGFDPALLSEGEFVVRADAVSAFGGGATDPGVQVLEQIVEMVLKMDREAAALFGDAIVQVGKQIMSVPTKSTEE
jgi:hypothetical protein